MIQKNVIRACCNKSKLLFSSFSGKKSYLKAKAIFKTARNCSIGADWLSINFFTHESGVSLDISLLTLQVRIIGRISSNEVINQLIFKQRKNTKKKDI